MEHIAYGALVTDEDKAHKKKEKLVLARDPIEEDIKKGLSLEEMRKRLAEKSHYDRIRFLEGLLSRKAPSLPNDTMANLDTIRKESYRFFGDECMGAKDFVSAAESYSKAGEDGLAGGAWKLAGDAYMEEAGKGHRGGEEAAMQAIQAAQGHGPVERHEGSRPGEAMRAPPSEKPKEGKAQKPSTNQEKEKEANAKKGPEEGKEEKSGARLEKEEKEPNARKAPEEGKKEEKKKGRITVSLYEKAAESYENANQEKMAESAWKKAGDDYLAMASANGNDSRYLREALRCYIKANDGRMSGYVGLMTGMPLKDVESYLSKANVIKDDCIIMARDLLAKQYHHAAKFLFERAGEKELAKMVSEMEPKSVKK
jgi:hypothetical protein